MEVTITRDRKRLEELEGIIEKNLNFFYEVGKALIEIKKDGLYAHKKGGAYQTYEAYCRGEWDLSKMHAYRLIDSCSVVNMAKSNQLVTIQKMNVKPARSLY